MTVEQRITDQWGNVIETETETIEPGKSLKTNVTAVGNGHPHGEQDFEITALCEADDSFGTIVIESAGKQIRVVNFNADKKPKEFIRRDGDYLVIEWEHKVLAGKRS